MEDFVTRLLRWLDGKELELEVEEELRFHMERLCQEHREQGFSMTEAQEASLKRFGNVERVKRQCVEISKRSRPLMRILKVLFTLLFFGGVLVRVFRTDLHVSRVGDVLMMVAVSGRLFLYVRGLSPASFLSSNKTSWPLRLNDRSQMPVASYDEKKRTPTERVISG